MSKYLTVINDENYVFALFICRNFRSMEKKFKKNFIPTYLLAFFCHVTRNRHIFFLFGLIWIWSCVQCKVTIQVIYNLFLYTFSEVWFCTVSKTFFPHIFALHSKARRYLFFFLRMYNHFWLLYKMYNITLVH